MKTFDTTSREAIARLYDLSRSGDTGSCEFGQLDSMVYAQLMRSYETGPEQHTAQDRAAA